MKGFIYIFLCLIPWPLQAQWSSTIAWVEPDSSLSYVRDEADNMIPDFSHAGYMGGGIEIPTVATELTISPIPGDNTDHVQAAIDLAAQLPKDAVGIRGAILLKAGRYEIHGTIHLNQDGVILRGEGDGADTLTNTVLIGVGNTPNQRDVIVAGGGSGTSWSGRVANTKTDVISDLVKVGEYRFKIANPSVFHINDNIILYHPCTQAWLDAIDGGGTDNEPNWTLGSQPLVFNRRIVDVEDSMITVDVPFYNHLDRSLAQSYIYTYDRAGLLTQIGIENLRVDIETAGGTDEAHAWNAVKMKQVEDSWVRNCTFLHFGLAGVATETATRITVENCQALDPVAQVTGARMYNFDLLKASSQVLFKDCYASNGRHHYVSNGTSWVSGCVFLNCVSDAAYNASEGHRRWSMGLLFDNHVEVAIRASRTLLGLYNRGNYGTAHGWSAVHSVAWNCDVKSGRLVVEKPPTAQNYAIGCSGTISGTGPFNQAAGYQEGSNVSDLHPASLYEAQLIARQKGLEPTIITTGLNASPLTLAMSVFPNPASELLYVELDEAIPDMTHAILFDVAGRKQLEASFRFRTALSLTALPKGVYLLQLDRGNARGVRRILKE
ncbi:MAG: T9SS type A sorting domain-containing protein [Bacteroidota bacterium]